MLSFRHSLFSHFVWTANEILYPVEGFLDTNSGVETASHAEHVR